MEFEPGMWKWLKNKVLRASWLSLSVDLLREGDKHHMWGIKRISSFFPKPFHLKWKSLSCVWIFVTPPWTVHGILQTRILEWVAFPFSRGSSQPRDWTQVSCIAGRFFTSWATREAQEYWSGQPIPSPVNLPNPGVKPGSPTLQSLPTELSVKPS